MGRPRKKNRKPYRDPRRRRDAEMLDVTVSVPDNRVEAVKRFAGRLARRHPAQREEVLYQLRKHRRELARFGVRALSLFGSVSRNTSTFESDVDLLVEFQPGSPSGLFEFVELQNLLSAIVHRPVDLITPGRIKPRLKARITKELIRVL